MRSTMHHRPDLLAGAALHILDDDDTASKSSSFQDVIVYIRALGGEIVKNVQDATHAVLIEEPKQMTAQLETKIVTAQASSIPIVAARPWLSKCESLGPTDHWSDVSVQEVTPAIVQGDLQRAMVAVPTRRDHRHSLSHSISQTFQFLKQEDPDLLEQNALKRAMELSMLDCAIVLTSRACTPTKNNNTSSRTPQESPHQILGISPHATPLQIKAAYRKLAKLTHPDKGGSEEAFQKVARAYRSLLAKLPNFVVTDKLHREPKHLKSTAHWDNELADHRRLVEELFQSHGANLELAAQTQQNVLEHGLKLQARSAGSTNVNEREELIHNSCFYLSLAASYLSGIGALILDDAVDDHNRTTTSLFGEEDQYLIGETALQLKRRIEAAVVAAHPEWAAKGMVGEEVQAFSDFLVYLLDSPQAVVSEWAVVVFDTTSGMVDIYKGKYYDDLPQGHASNCLTVQYMPGHYEPLLPMNPEQRPTLPQILEVLDANGVLYVVTDGAA